MRDHIKIVFSGICLFVILTACSLEQKEEVVDKPVVVQTFQPPSYKIDTLKDQWGKCDNDSSSYCARINLSYPYFNDSLVVSKNLNDLIGKMITKEVLYDSVEYRDVPSFAKSFLQQYQEQQEEYGDSFGWVYKAEGSVPRNDSLILAIEIKRDIYTGGAHGIYSVLYANVNPRSGEKISLQDILSPGFEQKLNTAAKKAFMQKKGFTTEEELKENGYNFEEDMYYNDNFMALKEGLKFYFNSYEIAAFAAGPSEILVPWSEIRSVVKPAFRTPV